MWENVLILKPSHNYKKLVNYSQMEYWNQELRSPPLRINFRTCFWTILKIRQKLRRHRQLRILVQYRQTIAIPCSTLNPLILCRSMFQLTTKPMQSNHALDYLFLHHWEYLDQREQSSLVKVLLRIKEIEINLSSQNN